MPAGAVTVPRTTIEGQKVGRGSMPGHLCPFSKSVGIPYHTLAYEITQPIKVKHPISQAALSPSECVSPRPTLSPFETDCTLPMECVYFKLLLPSLMAHTLSLNKFTYHFASCWIPLCWDIENLSFSISWDKLCDFSWKEDCGFKSHPRCSFRLELKRSKYLTQRYKFNKWQLLLSSLHH